MCVGDPLKRRNEKGKNCCKCGQRFQRALFSSINLSRRERRGESFRVPVRTMEASWFSQQLAEHALDQSVASADPSHDDAFDGVRQLERSDIDRILEGMLLNQMISILAPCFQKRKIRQESEHESCSFAEAALSSTTNEADLFSPSESDPRVVNPRAPSVKVIDMDFICAEIEERTGFCDSNFWKLWEFNSKANLTGNAFYRPRSPKIDIFVARKLAVLITILQNFKSNTTCTKREVYYRNERFQLAE